MHRWATTEEEIRHLTEIRHSIEFGLIRVRMADGRIWAGVVTGSNGGNNASEAIQTGRWKYFGTVTVLATDGNEVIIDLMDVASAEPAPDIKDQMKKILGDRGWLAE